LLYYVFLFLDFYLQFLETYPVNDIENYSVPVSKIKYKINMN